MIENIPFGQPPELKSCLYVPNLKTTNLKQSPAIPKSIFVPTVLEKVASVVRICNLSGKNLTFLQNLLNTYITVQLTCKLFGLFCEDFE